MIFMRAQESYKADRRRDRYDDHNNIICTVVPKPVRSFGTLGRLGTKIVFFVVSYLKTTRQSNRYHTQRSTFLRTHRTIKK